MPPAPASAPPASGWPKGLAALWLSVPLQQAGRPFDELAGEVATLLGRAFIPPTPTAPSDPAPPV